MNENIIRTISSEMNRYLNNYQMSKLQEVLYKKVEIEKKEISNDEYVNKFINSKRLEGCSELTIKNYKIHIYKMLSYLGKDVRTIETDDIRAFLSYYQSNNNCNNLTIDGVRRPLSSFFNFLEVEDYKFIPNYLVALCAPHMSTTRYLKCPKCNKKSWSKKVMSKRDEN